jgi:TRAP-type transport system periplasmic protein
MNLSRRSKFVFGGMSTVGVFGLVQGTARPAQFEYKSAHGQAVDTPVNVWMVRLWEQVAKETNGRLVVRVYPAGELGGQGALLSQVRINAIQFVLMGDGIYGEAIPAAAIDSLGFAFKDPVSAWGVMNGALGDYIRKEFAARGLFVAKGAMFDQGMNQLTSSTKPIRNADDLAGFKLRVPPAGILVDLFRTLGAAPVALDGTQLYPALQSHLVDGQSNIMLAIEAFKIYEVQKYVSIVNAYWTGAWYVGNAQAWQALPADIQAITQRNIAKFSALQRNDSNRINNTIADKLQRQGLIFNTANTQAMRARLGPYFAKWKSEFGGTLWALLEAGVGGLS